VVNTTCHQQFAALCMLAQAAVLPAFKSMDLPGATFARWLAWPDAEGRLRTLDDFKKVFYRKQPGAMPGSYTMHPTAAPFVFVREGRVRLYARYGQSARDLAADTRRLIEPPPQR
jgi:cytochrome oxidase Cu insertion factor (SCO1/SenC/PrrC family)